MGLNTDPDRGGLTPEASASLDSAVRFGVDEEALVLYGRWWQLETWLREVAYLELRSKYGVKWTVSAMVEK